MRSVRTGMILEVTTKSTKDTEINGFSLVSLVIWWFQLSGRNLEFQAPSQFSRSDFQRNHAGELNRRYLFDLFEHVGRDWSIRVNDPDSVSVAGAPA